MPLLKSNLNLSILKITAIGNPIHEGFPKDLEEAAERWATAVNDYASQIIPISTTSDLAKQSLKSMLLTFPTVGIAAFHSGLVSYASQLSLGMLPAFTAVIPPTPPSLESAFLIGTNGGSAEDVANLLSTLIDAWFKTGTAINTSSGVTINWN